MEFLHALHFISDVRPVPNMFPNLHTLTCKWSRESSSFSSYSIFVHAGLKNLYFEFNYSSHKFSPKFIPFTMPLMHLHGLRRFHIEVPDHASEVQNLRDTVIALRELPYLETLLLPLYAASAEILGTVSELPVLEEFLSGEHGRVTICGCRNKVLSPTFKVGCFPVLRCLTIAGCVAELVAIIQHPYFPVTIDYLTVDHKNCTQGGNNLTLFHESLVDKCHKLEEYSLLSSLDGPPLPFGEIRPLFALKLLRCLEIEGRVPLTFTSDEIQELGLSLPELETLRLTQRPLSLGSIPAVAIETLQAIAQFCPKLKTLGLSMDTSNVSTENIFRIKPFNSSLCELNIGQSRLPIENLGKTAIYLAQVLPPECEITIDSELYSDDDEDMRAWTALNKLLPDLRKVKDLGQ
ncbi:hypothetical protein H0H93_007967 [Arthromyces matolae]|nr:hypothetical protein H0H93_007967 [Arthromyces matolae]